MKLEWLYNGYRIRQGGGVAIYIHESLKFENTINETFINLEAVILKIKLKKAKPLVFITWYRPPNSSREVLTMYDNMLSSIEVNDTTVVLMGDVNYNILQSPLSTNVKYTVS